MADALSISRGALPEGRGIGPRYLWGQRGASMKRLSLGGTAQGLSFVRGAIRVAIFATIAFHSARPPFAQSPTSTQLPSFPGGFVEKTNSNAVRPLLTATQIQSLLPVRGAFVFPAPYNTQA